MCTFYIHRSLPWQTGNCYADIRFGFSVLWNLVRWCFNCILILGWPLIFTWEPSWNFRRVFLGFFNKNVTFSDLSSDALVTGDNGYPLWHMTDKSSKMVQYLDRTYPYICSLVLSGELRSTNLSTILTVSMLVGINNNLKITQKGKREKGSWRELSKFACLWCRESY